MNIRNAKIQEIFVKSRFQRQGIANELLLFAEKWVKRKDVNVIRLESASGLKGAHKFYERCGFVDYAKGYQERL